MSGYIGNIPVPQSTQTRDNFTATSGQTTFSTSGYTPSYLDVYLNGVHLDPSDYTATNGTDVVLGTGATAGDIVSVVAFSTFEVNSGFHLGDNDKAIFGAGSDLQIFHDGSNSYINDAGTGYMVLTSSGPGIRLNSDTAEVMLDATPNGAVTLYYDNSPKLATTSTGIDVTGTVTADGLTVDGNGANITLNSTLTAVGSGNTLANINFDGSDASTNADGTRAQIKAQYRGVNGATSLNFYTATESTTSLVEHLRINHNGDISFYEDTGTTAKFFWDASAESLGIGTTSPSVPLHVNGVARVDSYLSMGNNGYIRGDFSGELRLQAGTSGITFYNESNNTERMRIDSSGNLLVGKTSANVSSTGYEVRAGSSTQMIMGKSYSGTVNGLYLHHNGSYVGGINYSNTSTSFATSSDYRLKTDVQPMTGATERLKALKPVNFEWISSGERVDGFLAHEAQEVVPEAVTGTKDAMRTEEYEVTPAVLDDDGNVVTEAVMGEREVPDYQGIDQSKLVPLLVAAMQEQQTVIEDLKARIEVLEGESA